MTRIFGAFVEMSGNKCEYLKSHFSATATPLRGYDPATARVTTGDRIMSASPTPGDQEDHPFERGLEGE